MGSITSKQSDKVDRVHQLHSDAQNNWNRPLFETDTGKRRKSHAMKIKAEDARKQQIKKPISQPHQQQIRGYHYGVHQLSQLLVSLECIDLNISNQEWKQCLVKLDNDITKMHDKCNDIIIISMPYRMNEIKEAIQEYILQTFDDESLLYCFDIIIEFIIPNNQIIQQKMEMHDLYDKWNKNKYDQLLSTKSLIIINSKNCHYISIPRDVNQLNLKWKISWNKSNDIYSQINQNICNNISNNYLPKHFKVTNDWSKRTDFRGVDCIGYLCDEGEIILGELTTIHATEPKIFIHWNTDADHFGAQFGWLSVPNERICPPPKDPPKQRVMGFGKELKTYIIKRADNQAS